MQFVESFKWIETFHINYTMGVDGLSFPLIVLTALICLLAGIYALNIELRVKEFFFWFLILLGFTMSDFLPATLFDRARLRAGDAFDGPAIIEQFDSTTIVLAGQSAGVDDIGNLIIDTIFETGVTE